MKKGIGFMLIITFMLFFASSIFAAYSDFAVNNVEMPKTLTADENFTVNIELLNSSPNAENIDVSTIIYNNKGFEVSDDSRMNTYNVPANNKKIVTETFISVQDVNLEKSTQPYYAKVVILNDINGTKSNDTFIQYFTVTKSSSKVPVPDMPYYFGFLVAFLVAFFVVSDKKKNKKSEK